MKKLSVKNVGILATANNIIKNNDDTLESISYVATMGAMILAIGAFAVLTFVMPLSMANILAGICVINVVFHNFFADKIFGPKVKKISDIYCAAFLMLTMPIQWFGIGGFRGMGALWMIFAALYCIFSVSGRIQSVMLILYGLEVVAILVVNWLYPEFETPVDSSKLNIIAVASIIGISSYIQAIVCTQQMLFAKDKKLMQEMQEDLTAHYEESLAVNTELMQTTEKLEVANKTQKSFTASMNHELRAPLNGIEGCLQILLMDETISGEAKETVKNALTASKTINQTVNDLLDFAKLEDGKFDIVNRNFDLRDVLDNITTIFRPLANAKNLKLYIQIPRDARVSIYGDGTRIQQVITNLVSNGIKYTHEGSVTLTIKTERGHLYFDIKDTGQGMDEASLKVLFDPFTRFNLNENVNIEGTGLGMNIVHNLVKAMGGIITVDSKVNVGTSFHVDIPIMFYDSDIVYSTPRDKLNAASEKVDLSAYKILCVDDTEINRTVFKGMLNKTGAYVVLAENGSKAIEICEEQGFDIIFMDHMMPEMDGITAMECIHAIDERFARVPVVMFTGNSGDEYKKMYKERGAFGSLLKPIMYEELIECIRRALM